MVQQASPREVILPPPLGARKGRTRVYPQIDSWVTLNDAARRESLPDTAQHSPGTYQRSPDTALDSPDTSQRSPDTALTDQSNRDHDSYFNSKTNSDQKKSVERNILTECNSSNLLPKVLLAGRQNTEQEKHYIRLKKKVNFSETCNVYSEVPTSRAIPLPCIAKEIFKNSNDNLEEKKTMMHYSEFQPGCDNVRRAQNVPLVLMHHHSAVYGSDGIIPMQNSSNLKHCTLNSNNLTHPLSKISSYCPKKVQLTKSQRYVVPYQHASRYPQNVSSHSTNVKSSNSKIKSTVNHTNLFNGNKSVLSDLFPQFSSISRASTSKNCQTTTFDISSLEQSCGILPRDYSQLSCSLASVVRDVHCTSSYQRPLIEPIPMSSAQVIASLKAKHSRVPELLEKHMKFNFLDKCSNVSSNRQNISVPKPSSQFETSLTSSSLFSNSPGVLNRSSTFTLDAPSSSSSSTLTAASCASSSTQGGFGYQRSFNSPAGIHPATRLGPCIAVDTRNSSDECCSPSCSSRQTQKRLKLNGESISTDKHVRYGRLLTEDDVKECLALRASDAMHDRQFHRIVAEAKRLIATNTVVSSIGNERVELPPHPSPSLRVTSPEDVINSSYDIARDKVGAVTVV